MGNSLQTDPVTQLDADAKAASRERVRMSQRPLLTLT